MLVCSFRLITHSLTCVLALGLFSRLVYLVLSKKSKQPTRPSLTLAQVSPHTRRQSWRLDARSMSVWKKQRRSEMSIDV